MHANLHVNVITRSVGQSALNAAAYRSAQELQKMKATPPRSTVAAAAYRAGDKVNDERYEKSYDYTHKHNVLHAEIITPEGAPEWMNDREKLWNAVETGEKRKDARLAKEILLVLPRNLDVEQHKEVVRIFIGENLTKHGLVADYAIHSPDASDGGKNPHAHIMLTLRPVEGEGFGKKLTGFKNVLDNPDTIPQWRQSYEKILNDASQKATPEISFDLRSLKEKGINREPMPKIGQKVTHLEKQGYRTEWGKEVRDAQHRNHAAASQAGHQSYHRLTSAAARTVDTIRDDIAHKYYEVIYGAELAYREYEQQRENDGYQRER